MLADASLRATVYLTRRQVVLPSGMTASPSLAPVGRFKTNGFGRYAVRAVLTDDGVFPLREHLSQ